MDKEIICVYQDCVMCGDRGKKLKQLVFEKNLNVRKVSFASPEGRELSFKAIQNRICRMPFFTDGDRYTNNIEDLLEPGKKTKRVYKKTTKKVKLTKKKEVADGVDS